MFKREQIVRDLVDQMQEADACNNGICLGVLPRRKEESLASMPSFGKPTVALDSN